MLLLLDVIVPYGFFFQCKMATPNLLKPVLSTLEVPGDDTFATLTGDLCWPGPHLKVDLDKCENTPYWLLDRLLANGGPSQGAVKIRIYSASGRPVPTPFKAFLRGEWCDPFGDAADDGDLIDHYFEYGIVLLERDQVYRRWTRPVPKPGLLRSVIRNWTNRGLMRIDPSVTPDSLLTSAFLGFRRASERVTSAPGIPYLADWSCSLFRIHHVNFCEKQEWQQDNHFGVTSFPFFFSILIHFFRRVPSMDALYLFILLLWFPGRGRLCLRPYPASSYFGVASVVSRHVVCCVVFFSFVLFRVVSVRFLTVMYRCRGL